MGDLTDSAKQIVVEIIERVGQDDPDVLKKALSRGYKEEYCRRVLYAETSSGYKAWRRQVRIALGMIPKRKTSPCQLPIIEDLPGQLKLEGFE